MQNKKLENIMWLYSAKKNRANDIEEYSAHQSKNVDDKFQAISTKPPTPNQGNI